MTAGEVVTPKCLYHPLFVTPEWFYCPYSSPHNFQAAFSLPLNVFITLRSSPRQSLSRGPKAFKNQRRSKNVDSRLKISGMTEGVDSLNASIRDLNNRTGKPLCIFPSPSE